MQLADYVSRHMTGIAHQVQSLQSHEFSRSAGEDLIEEINEQIYQGMQTYNFVPYQFVNTSTHNMNLTDPVVRDKGVTSIGRPGPLEGYSIGVHPNVIYKGHHKIRSREVHQFMVEKGVFTPLTLDQQPRSQNPSQDRVFKEFT
ncbi:hypothetical protein KC19_VG314200 [Ceratodon purpureus]|uniref:Uncharacterized protein n=1 Tax=Ceratodon purpureus TaxID=3225 RepID=A0A8T0HW96_CERPU|nr:hypothetical protein KC19_VG314200 [Ceratodon purpureus]